MGAEDCASCSESAYTGVRDGVRISFRCHCPENREGLESLLHCLERYLCCVECGFLKGLGACRLLFVIALRHPESGHNAVECSRILIHEGEEPVHYFLSLDRPV